MSTAGHQRQKKGQKSSLETTVRRVLSTGDLRPLLRQLPQLWPDFEPRQQKDSREFIGALASLLQSEGCAALLPLRWRVSWACDACVAERPLPERHTHWIDLAASPEPRSLQQLFDAQTTGSVCAVCKVGQLRPQRLPPALLLCINVPNASESANISCVDRILHTNER